MLLVFTGFISTGFSQVRFKDYVYPDLEIQRNIPYIPGQLPHKGAAAGRLDLYQPSGDTSAKRPLVIWLHGGGFKFGNKTSRGTPVWSQTFAKRGYVCAAANYRLSKRHPLNNYKDLVMGCEQGVEDAMQVMAFFRKNAALYRLDTSRFFLAGNSAGAMIALQAVYSSLSDLKGLAGTPDSPEFTRKENTCQVAGIISFWGSIFDSAWMKNARVPMVFVHGSRDRVVPLDQKPGIAMYGSLAIHRWADSLGIPNRLKIVAGRGHELQKHFNPLWSGISAKRRQLEAGQFAADFLYDLFFR